MSWHLSVLGTCWRCLEQSPFLSQLLQYLSVLEGWHELVQGILVFLNCHFLLSISYHILTQVYHPFIHPAFDCRMPAKHQTKDGRPDNYNQEPFEYQGYPQGIVQRSQLFYRHHHCLVFLNSVLWTSLMPAIEV